MKALFTALAMALLTNTALAGVVSFTFEAGPVTFVETGLVDPEVAGFQDFVLGEAVLVTITVDDSTPDLDPDSQRGEFEDPTGTITLTGADSGASILMGEGVNIQLDSVFEFDVRNIAFGPTLHTFELFDDIDYRAGVPLFSDPDSLVSSMAELTTLVDAQNRFINPNFSLKSWAAVGVLDSFGPFVALEFGPVLPASLPATLVLLMLGSVLIPGMRKV